MPKPVLARVLASVAALDAAQEATENSIELVRPFPEWRVSRSCKAVAATIPQIFVRHAVDVIEVDDAVGGAIHHRDRDRRGFDGKTLVDAGAGPRDLE
jgi:hypothetical protein